jgi:hypothetical protein
MQIVLFVYALFKDDISGSSNGGSNCGFLCFVLRRCQYITILRRMVR